jgi:acyl-CoA synthetase (AMP-forming)/AMP-acid ligase II
MGYTGEHGLWCRGDSTSRAACLLQQRRPQLRVTSSPHTQVRVVDPEALTDVPNAGDSGVLLCRGPQVMRSTLGYEGNAQANARAFPLGAEWFYTGDLGFVCPSIPRSRMAGMVVLTGRAKARMPCPELALTSPVSRSAPSLPACVDRRIRAAP